MPTYFVAIGFFKNYDGTSDVYDVDVLGVFEEELQAQQACIQYVKETLVERFSNYLKDNPHPGDQTYAQEWLQKIASIESLEPSKQLSYLSDVVYEEYEGLGPTVRIVQRAVTHSSS